MFRLIPNSLHHLILEGAYKARHYWRRIAKTQGNGVTVIGRDFDGNILMVRHSYGPRGWFFPGGGIGRGETPESAARRELREEIGCEIESLSLVGVLDEQISGAPHRGHVFEGVVNSQPRADGREVVEARFFPTHSLPEPLGGRTAARLRLWLDARRRGLEQR